MKKDNIIIGCSAFNNPNWQTIFYPTDVPRDNWFQHYCMYFNSYELNASFYTFPTANNLSAWYRTSPNEFIISVKAPRLITHDKRFVDCERHIDRLYNACRNGLKEKLGCVLFQFPGSFDYDYEILEMIVQSLDPEFDNVIEFRNGSWWNKEVYELLNKYNVTFCGVSYPKLPDKIIETNSIGYIRLHGNPTLFYSEYSQSELNAIYHKMLEKEKWKKAYIYFNNTASTAGILNAMTFSDLIL